MLINCRECKKQISDEATTCPACGCPVSATTVVNERPTVVTPEKSRSVAILLALFLGGLGIHRFYLNQPGQGVIYLIFCWTFIPLVFALCEAVYWLFTSDEKFQQAHC